jgi:hypothetical protein
LIGKVGSVIDEGRIGVPYARDDLSRAHGEADVEQHIRFAIGNREVFDDERAAGRHAEVFSSASTSIRQ